jgi:hypothetical protein
MSPAALFVVGIILIVLGWFVQSNIFEWLLNVLGVIIIIIGVVVIVIAGISFLTGRNRSSSGF